MRGRVAQGTRYSSSLHEHLLYVAVPAAAGGVVDGAVRITYPTSAVDARITRYWLILLAIAAVVLALAAAAGMRLATFLIRPLRELERTAKAVGDGDLAVRAPESEGAPRCGRLRPSSTGPSPDWSSCCGLRASSLPTHPISCGRR